jgi:hypothetical protein
MTSLEDFRKWFNRDFWRAFKNRTFPIRVPETPDDREATVRKVYDSIHSARYASSIPEAEIVANKGYGIARTIPVFCIEDYIVYYFCIKELEDVLCGNRTEHTFGGWTLGGRMRRLEEIDIEFDTGFSGSRYSFNPSAWIQAFGEFNSLLYAQLDTGEFSHVLQFDLSNFYDCVRLDILERWIREECLSDKGWIIALLFYFLNQWNRRNTGLHPQAVGIPQDALADCSRILANYYLQRYDKFAAAICTKAAAVYFRYADDQMILLRNREVVEGLMLLLSRNLDRYGLRVNQKKVELWEVGELQEHRCRRLQGIFAKKGDNKDPALVRAFVESYLKISDEALKSSWNGGLPILNRLLWAKLESLPQRLFEKIVIRFTSDDYLLRADNQKLVRIHGLNLKRKRPLDFSQRIYDLSARCVHNGFLYEALSFSKALKDYKLSDHLRNRLGEVEKEMLSNELQVA